MNKKIFKSLFMGALLVGSVGTLTSCSKDYDNDINSLKDQIAKLATTEALNAKVTELQTSIASVKTSATAAQTTATTALNNAATNATALATLKSSVSDLSAIVATKADQTAFNAAIANMNSLLANKVDQSAYNTKIADLESYIKTNSANIDKNTAALEAYKKVVDEKINAIVADIEAKYATKEALNEAVTNLTTQLGALPTKDYVAEQIAAAVKNLANKDDVTAEIAAAVKGLASEEYVTNAIKDLASKSDVATAKEEVLKAMSENNDALKAYIAAAIASQAGIDAANLAAKVTEINDLIKSNKDESDAALAAAKIELSQQINSVKSTLETQFNTNLAEAVSNLTTLINGKASAEELAAAKSALQDEIDAATGRIGDLETAVGDLKTRVGALETNLNNKVEIADFNTAIRTLTDSYTGLKNQIEALMTKINSMVTNVDVIKGTDKTTGIEYNSSLAFSSFIENATKFGPTNSEVEFKAGTVNATEDALLLRVNPTTAELDASQIHLLNSQNEDLTKYLNVSIEPYQGTLVSRAATSSKSGLWVAKFSLKSDADVKAFANAVGYAKDKDTYYYVDFCVAINNALVGTDRAVVSPYEVNVAVAPAEKASEILAKVGGKEIDDIYNRYNVGNFKEKVWITSTTANPTPDIRENISDKNTTNSDDRSGKTEYANAYIGQPLTIDFYKMVSGKPESTTVRAFYVTLDNDYAETTGTPSEAYIWSSYTIDGLGKVFENTNSGSITIKSPAAKGDVIGFRIYAVNYDGTLQDPDGRPFYVKVAAPTATATYDTKIIPTSATEVSYSANVPVTEDLSALAEATSASTESMQEKTNPLYGIQFLAADGTTVIAQVNSDNSFDLSKVVASAKDIKFVRTFIAKGDQSKFNDSSESLLIDYLQSFYFMDANGAKIFTIDTNMNKIMPTAPTSFSIKTEQNVGGKFFCYLPDLITDNAYATEGNMGLKNAFNGLYDSKTSKWDERYSITFEGAGADDATGKATNLTIEYVNLNGSEHYNLTVGADRILNDKKEYNTVVNYNFGKISSADPTKDYLVKVTSFPTTFRSYLQDPSTILTWSWPIANKVEVVPELTYGVAGEILGSKLTANHIYNSSEYGKDLVTLESGSKLKIVEAHLYSDINDVKTKDEYFTVSWETVTSGTGAAAKTYQAFVFSVNPSTTQGPKATVKSTLRISAKDAFGKAITIDKTVNVLKP